MWKSVTRITMVLFSLMFMLSGMCFADETGDADGIVESFNLKSRGKFNLRA